MEEAKGLLLKGQSPVITGSVGENSEFTYVYEISPPDVNGGAGNNCYNFL